RSFWHRGDEGAQHGIHCGRDSKHLGDIGVKHHHEMSSLTPERKTIRTSFPIIKVVFCQSIRNRLDRMACRLCKSTGNLDYRQQFCLLNRTKYLPYLEQILKSVNRRWRCL